MKRARFTEGQIIAGLKEHEAGVKRRRMRSKKLPAEQMLDAATLRELLSKKC